MFQKAHYNGFLILVFLAFIVSTETLCAQCQYYKNYNVTSSNNAGLFTEKVDDYVHMFGSANVRDTIALNTSFVVKLDQCGNIEQENLILDTTNFFIVDITEVGERYILLAQIRDDNEMGTDSYLFEYQPNSLTLSPLVNLDQGTNEKSLKVLSKGDSVFIMGYIDNLTNQTARLYVTKYDLNSGFSHTDFYPFNYYILPKSFEFDKDSNFIITGNDRNRGDKGIFCTKVNRNGTEHWRRVTFQNHDLQGVQSVMNEDSSVLVIGNYIMSNEVVRTFFWTIDKDGNHVNDTVVAFKPGIREAISSVKKVGTELLATGIYFDVSDTLSRRKTLLVKFDSNYDTLWYHSYSLLGPSSDEYPLSIEVDEFGSIYVTGYFINFDTIPNRAFQLKVDSNGCLQNCNVGLDDRFIRKSFDVYPNPNPGSFKLRFSEEVEGEVQIFSYDGRLVHRQAYRPKEDVALNVSAGIYLVSFQTVDGRRFDSKVIIE